MLDTSPETASEEELGLESLAARCSEACNAPAPLVARPQGLRAPGRADNAIRACTAPHQEWLTR
jgi:hypothetical protein